MHMDTKSIVEQNTRQLVENHNYTEAEVEAARVQVREAISHLESKGYTEQTAMKLLQEALRTSFGTDVTTESRNIPAAQSTNNVSKLDTQEQEVVTPTAAAV